jgi:large subunit ribosomal protein L15
MVVRRSKKSKKFRGHTTHGYGSMKKHRGAGHRGGRGMAGSGKRGDQKKSRILKEVGLSYFGKHGFTVPQAVKRTIKAINIEQLPQQDTINLTEQGFNKLLAKGKPQRKYHITVKYCSQRAKEKIEKAGGKVELQE